MVISLRGQTWHFAIVEWFRGFVTEKRNIPNALENLRLHATAKNMYYTEDEILKKFVGWKNIGIVLDDIDSKSISHKKSIKVLKSTFLIDSTHFIE